MAAQRFRNASGASPEEAGDELGASGAGQGTVGGQPLDVLGLRKECGSKACLVVRFNDLNGTGLNKQSILDAADEFEVWANGQKVNVTFGTPFEVAGQINTWAYVITGGWAPVNGIVEVRFLPGGVTDFSGSASAGETERFFLVNDAVNDEDIDAGGDG